MCVLVLYLDAFFGIIQKLGYFNAVFILPVILYFILATIWFGIVSGLIALQRRGYTRFVRKYEEGGRLMNQSEIKKLLEHGLEVLRDVSPPDEE